MVRHRRQESCTIRAFSPNAQLQPLHAVCCRRPKSAPLRPFLLHKQEQGYHVAGFPRNISGGKASQPRVVCMSTSNTSVLSPTGTQVNVTVTSNPTEVDCSLAHKGRYGKWTPWSSLADKAGLQTWPGPRSGSCHLLGMDVEWRPNLRRGEANSVALLQLATDTHCLIVQMLHLSHVPDSLQGLMSADDVALCGVGVRPDLRKLHRDFNLGPHGIGGWGYHSGVVPVDVGEMAGQLRLRQGSKADRYWQFSLRMLCTDVLGAGIEKSGDVQVSNWAALRLTEKQVKYTAWDAWVSYKAAAKLLL